MSNTIRIAIFAGGLTLAACQTVEPSTAPVVQEHSEGRALAQAACAGCHSVEPHGLSPNPEAPEWTAIANSRGVTRETLAHWLAAAHNYPEQMDFYLEDDEVDLLVDYMLTLRRDDYHPAYQ